MEIAKDSDGEGGSSVGDNVSESDDDTDEEDMKNKFRSAAKR